MNAHLEETEIRSVQHALIAVVPLGKVGDDVLRVIADNLQGILKLPVDLFDAEHLPPETFMEDRKQYNALGIMKHLSNSHFSGALKVIGVTTKDLCNPIFTHVFGEAYMGGRSAVLSCFRLYAGLNGGYVSRDHFFERVAKVALHEIGHTFNLPHCHTGRCVMRASNTLAELDDKLNYLCDYCELFLFEAVKESLRAPNLNESEQETEKR